MPRRIVLALVLALSLTSMLTLPFHIQPTRASGTIHIRADGSIEGTTNIFSDDNVTYTLNATVNDSIVVERSNIVVDGARYTVNGSGTGLGFNLTNINNVTIKNTNIKNFEDGIYLEHSSDNTVSGNNITANNSYGINLRSSSNSIISKNSITTNEYGVNLDSVSFGNIVSGNSIVDNDYGVHMDASFGNIVSGNLIMDNVWGLYVQRSVDNAILGNIIVSNRFEGIQLIQSRDNRVLGNTITGNIYGMFLLGSGSNTLYHNNFNNTQDQIIVEGDNGNIWDNGYPSGGNYWSNYNGTDLSINELGVRPGYWIEYELNFTDPPTPPYAQWIRREILDVNGSTVTVRIIQKMSNGSVSDETKEGDIEEGTGAAALVFIPPNSEPGHFINIQGFGIVRINGTDRRTYLDKERNVLWANFSSKGFNVSVFWDKEKGVALEISYSRVGVQGTTIINNTNMWTSGSDGIGDTPYVIGKNNQDNYPLMGPFNSFDTSVGKNVNVISNSTIDGFEYEPGTIRFYVSNMTANQTDGFCRVTIPHDVLLPPFNVTVGYEYVDHDTIFQNNTHTIIYFNYPHSKMEVIIVPEFSSFLILPLFMMMTLLTVIFYRRKRALNA